MYRQIPTLTWAVCLLLATGVASAVPGGPFQPLDSHWPTPDEKRLATGKPGPAYWQQRVNYDIKAELDVSSKRIYGSATLEYFNNSPHALESIWVQLDQNRFDPNSRSARGQSLRKPAEDLTYREWLRLIASPDFQGGVRVTRAAMGELDLKRTLVDTMMRLDLPQPLEPGGRISLSIDWWFPLVDLNRLGGRSGYETLAGGHDIFVLAQWYPRVAAYTDYEGWQHKSFLGTGEFALEFGTFDVALTVPADHLVASTGELQNPNAVLASEQRSRYIRAQRSAEPVMVVNAEEVRSALRKKPSRQKKTWIFRAEGVRDFAMATSRAFIWDAMGLNLNGNWITVMSFYPGTAEPLWSKYASRAAALTLEVFSRHTFDYPYPVSVQVNGPVFGMEYPMMTFMSTRPYPDGSYWGAILPKIAESPQYSKYALISTTIHEVGHNWFPMIVNSDERRWTWMDEGLNTFLQFLTEQEWSKKYPSRRGWVDELAADMKEKKLRPIMSDADTLLNRGITGYAKPAAALNVLRELVLGRELFDDAFRTYATRWKFRRPTPADFFRSMEDASGTDLSWFWRTWFYSTGHVDVAVRSMRRMLMEDPDPDAVARRKAKEATENPKRLTDERNSGIKTYVERLPALKDFYDSYDPEAPTAQDRSDYKSLMRKLSQYEKEVLTSSDRYIYLVQLANVGGMVTPVPLRLHFADGQTEDLLLPAEIWRYNHRKLEFPLIRKEALAAIEFDPQRATGDANANNNRFPPLLKSIPTAPVKDAVPDNPLRKSRAR